MKQYRQCSHVFKSKECGYTGKVTVCGKTIDDCNVLKDEPTCFDGFTEADFEEQTKPKTFRKFFDERNKFEICSPMDKSGNHDDTIMRLMQTVGDYMDYIAGVEEPEPKDPEPEYKFQCNVPGCFHIFEKAVRQEAHNESTLRCPRCLSANYTSTQIRDLKPEE